MAKNDTHAIAMQLRRLVDTLTKRVEALEKEGKNVAIELGILQNELHSRFGNH